LDRQLRVLMVSHTFPPLAEVGTIRVTQLCRYLPDWGIEPIVLSAEERSYETQDYTRKLPPGLRVLRAPTMSTPLDWYGAARRQLGRSGPAHRPAGTGSNTEDIGILRRNFKSLLQVPDRYWGWYLPAIRMGTRLLRQEKIDAIYSSGPPWTSHLVARHLKRKFGLPWLIDFRDPWASAVPEEVKPGWWHHLAKRMEESCIRSSDLVLGNTERLTVAFQRRYADLDAAKFRTLTNGFEDPVIPPLRQLGSKKLLLHLGSLYAHRRIDTFLMAMADLVSSRRVAPESFETLFQGETEPSYSAEAARLVPQLMESGCIKFSPRINHEEASKLLWQADVLLLFQGSHALQVPAKFYEYLQTGIPILAVSEEGALPDVVAETEAGVWVRPGDPREIALALLRALERPAKNPDDVTQQFAGRYHYRNLARELSLWIAEVCAASG
jgi:glycosyltransferase involved in cell wall biosynthesis